ncbi:MAG: hypothetical protein ACI4QN_02405 [Candidatus Coproplasma sp.]
MNVKKLLKKQSSAIMPTDSVKRQIKADCGICEEVSAPVGGAAVKAKRRIGFSFAAVGAAAVVAVTCVLIFLKPVTPATIVPDIITFGEVSSATDFYAYGAVSVGNMLDGTEPINSAAAYSSSPSAIEEVTDEQKKILDKYAVFATGILGDGKITSSCTAADKAEYEFKLGIGYSDGFGSEMEKVLYFNKVNGSVKVKEDKEKFAIEGELITGNVSYPVEGKYEIETDGGETESEIEFTAFTSADRRSYIKMEYEYEIEADETESKVVVSVYENGSLIEKAKIKGETGDDMKFEVDVDRPAAAENVQIKFKPVEDGGKQVMQVDASFGNSEHKLIMQTRPKEEGGGFDFIHSPYFYPPFGFDNDWDDGYDWDYGYFWG